MPKVSSLQNLTIAEIIHYGTQQLIAGSDSAKLDVQVILGFILNKDLSYLLTWPDKSLSDSNIAQFLTLLSRREQGEPVAYLVGYQEFWSLNFKVSEATLIPRPDTEVLVELVLDNHAKKQLSCLDLGTGTGAIALALASEMPNWHIDAIDFQQPAVELAKFNAEQLALTNVNIYQSDWFQAIDNNKKFDVIVSNPPYIDAQDIHLNQGDVRFEPSTALVANNKGLADIEHIVKQAKTYLKSNAWLYLEHGFEQAVAVQAILLENGYHTINTKQDYSGNDRVTYACLG